MKRWGLALVVMNLCMGVVIMSCHDKKKGLEGEMKVGELRFVETNKVPVGDWNGGSTWVTKESPSPGGRVLRSDGADYVVITPEMEAVLKDDPVVQFFRRVKGVATKDPEWKRDFRAAEYRALMDEYEKHVTELLKKRGLISQDFGSKTK